MKKSLRSLLLATALVTVSYSAAFAEMIYQPRQLGRPGIA